MNINYKQPQFELFPANSATLEDIDKPRFLLANLTLSVESLVIFSILGIMVALFSFSLGVERGKHVAAETLDERVSAAWNVGARTAAPVVKPAAMAAASVVAARTVHAATLSVAGNRFTVQVASYGKEEFARQDAMLLKARNFQSFLIHSGKYWLLCVNTFSNKENAITFQRKLAGQYRNSQVRRF